MAVVNLRRVEMYFNGFVHNLIVNLKKLRIIGLSLS